MTSLQQQAANATTRRTDLSRYAGIAYLVLFTAGFLVIWAAAPRIYEGGSLDDYAAAFLDGSRTNQMSLVAVVLWPLAGVCLVWAVAHVAACLDRVSKTSLAGRLATVGAVVMAVGFTVAGAASSAAAHVSSGTGEGFPADPATGYGLDMLASQVQTVTAWGGSLVLLAVGIAARRTQLLPGWLLWAGIVIAPLLPIAFLFGMLPLLAFMLWLAAVGVMMKPGRVAVG
jgi:hypothetical protein